MITTIRRLGNSQGVLIPKPLLQQVGLVDQAEMLFSMAVSRDSSCLTRFARSTRPAWSSGPGPQVKKK